MSPVPDSLQYIVLMAACLVLTLPLEIILGARVYRRPLRLLQAILVTVIVFSLWDTVAIRGGLWVYSERFTSGVVLPFGLPLEEVIFFIVIPLCGILTYEAVGRVMAFFRSFTQRNKTTSSGDDDA